jgi:hypothetical protein
MKDRAPSLASVIPEMPMWVTGLVDKALAFKKDDRFASAVDMRMAVRAAFAQLANEAQRASQAPPPSADPASREVSAMFDRIIEPSIIVDVSFALDMNPQKRQG